MKNKETSLSNEIIKTEPFLKNVILAEKVREAVKRILKRIAKVKMLIGSYCEVNKIIDEEMGEELRK